MPRILPPDLDESTVSAHVENLSLGPVLGKHWVKQDKVPLTQGLYPGPAGRQLCSARSFPAVCRVGPGRHNHRLPESSIRLLFDIRSQPRPVATSWRTHRLRPDRRLSDRELHFLLVNIPQMLLWTVARRDRHFLYGPSRRTWCQVVPPSRCLSCRGRAATCHTQHRLHFARGNHYIHSAAGQQLFGTIRWPLHIPLAVQPVCLAPAPRKAYLELTPKLCAHVARRDQIAPRTCLANNRPRQYAHVLSSRLAWVVRQSGIVRVQAPIVRYPRDRFGPSSRWAKLSDRRWGSVP